jgi:hypothetical protein
MCLNILKPSQTGDVKDNLSNSKDASYGTRMPATTGTCKSRDASKDNKDDNSRDTFYSRREASKTGTGRHVLNACISSETRVSSKQTNKNFGLNRNKSKQDLFLLCFCLFRETKNQNFGSVWFDLVFQTCAADFSLLNLPKGKSLGRSKPSTNS